MQLVKDIDVLKITKLISQHVDAVTCLECCKYYLAPEKATCGHTLCHTCWKGRRVCPACAKSLERRALKLDKPVQTLTNHVRELVETFEQLFDVRMDDFMMDTPMEDKEADPTKHVKEWLTSSENHFSAPPYSDTQQSTQDILPAVTVSTTKIQVHAKNNRTICPKKVSHVSLPQDDWDKIEVVPDTEEMTEKPKENIVGPMDLEPFYFDENEYSNEHPRRSSRKRDNDKNTISPKKPDDLNEGTDKRLDKAKQNWKNVKKMKKEFSKLNKLNKNKLNVSIEMCKKTQSVKSKQCSIPTTNLNVEEVVIDDNTPDILHKNTKQQTELMNSNNMEDRDLISSESILDKTPITQKQTVTSKCKKIEQEKFKDLDKTANKDKIKNMVKDKVVIEEVSKLKQSTENVCNTDNVDVTEGTKESTTRIPFFKKSQFQAHNPPDNSKKPDPEETPEIVHSSNPDDIHISIRIGDVVTNITINKKQNDVQLKVNTDREVQTSLGSNCMTNVNQPETKMTKEQEVQTIVNDLQKKDNVSTQKSVKTSKKTLLDKSSSTKKNTASAETATVQFEITESVEKELSNIMECEENSDESPGAIVNTEKSNNNNNKETTQLIPKDVKTKDKNKEENVDSPGEFDDMDIFNSGSVKEQNVLMLKNAKHTLSEILPSNWSNKNKTQKSEKRNRDNVAVENMPSKRQKIESFSKIANVITELNETSDSPNYDDVMGELFANIDADIQEIQSQKLQSSKNKNITQSTQRSLNKVQEANTESEVFQASKPQHIDKEVVEKFSENMFSTVGNVLEKGNTHIPGPETQQNIDNLLTPGTCMDIVAPKQTDEIVVLCTPMGEEDDSDKSVVEETPQKNISIPKTKSRSDSNPPASATKKAQPAAIEINADKPESQGAGSVINLTDSIREPNRETKSTATRKETSETPLTINRFVDHIKHNSTPVARKSLNFQNNVIEDDDVTLCPTNISVGAKTTQEKQFMTEAFENGPNSPARKPLMQKNVPEKQKSFVIAGSCLTSSELTNIRILCFKKKWTYVEKYSPDVTHLVVGVDDECKAQRSVKYMCALAAGKWIVSIKWIEKCLETNIVVNEAPYEALDSTGECGPLRSRISKRKIFEGITFYCMPPFSVLDLDTLVSMLKVSGGRVVSEASEVRVTGSTPSLLLAEPENTQEDRFIYMAMELGIVPVNYEWALNCLGSYTLCSLQDLLLCPVTLLPKHCYSWPRELLVSED